MKPKLLSFICDNGEFLTMKSRQNTLGEKSISFSEINKLNGTGAT